MSSRTISLALATVSAGALMPAALSAATLASWNTDNVDVGPVSTDGQTEFSVIYDGAPDDPAAITNGRIAYTEPEANTPGLRVEDSAYVTGGSDSQLLSGCIMADSVSSCDGPFQSGKRFKEQLTGIGAIDLVFDVDLNTPALEDSVGYQVFHRLVNLTGEVIESFTIELGFGVGDDFVASGANDGLSFSAGFAVGPDGVNAFSQYPFGLFGDASTNPNFTLDGFFDDSRTGYDVVFGEDVISSAGLYGGYEELFGNWMSQDMAPEALLWDWDDGNSDPLVMAWDTGTGWELRRIVNDEGTYAVELDTPLYFDYGQEDEIAAFLGVELERDIIEDLANLNLNYAILLGDDFQYSNFTLRVVTVAETPAAVPLPPAAPLMAAGLGLIGLVRRRKGRAAS